MNNVFGLYGICSVGYIWFVCRFLYMKLHVFMYEMGAGALYFVCIVVCLWVTFGFGQGASQNAAYMLLIFIKLKPQT